MNPYALWILYFPLQLAISIFCKITAPVVCLFVTKELRTDRVKRFGNETLTFDREYLIAPFYYWQTFDNALDEYWFGMFTDECVIPAIRNATNADYVSKWWIRYACRVLWVWRNTAYGFAQFWFGRDPDQTHFQIKKDIPLAFGYYSSTNIGWKPHKGFSRLMYAGRIIGLRKNKG